MLYHQKPKNFHIEMKVWCVLIECSTEILLIKRSLLASSPGKWWEPSGKLEWSETYKQWAIRECFEESWIQFQETDLEHKVTKYFYFMETNIEMVFFRAEIDVKPKVILAPNEHSDYKWVNPKDALKMDLIEDFEKILVEIYSL
jgi:8-oxo-dGTP pyrophosphatase MutT (NUDIX family)